MSETDVAVPQRYENHLPEPHGLTAREHIIMVCTSMPVPTRFGMTTNTFEVEWFVLLEKHLLVAQYVEPK